MLPLKPFTSISENILVSANLSVDGGRLIFEYEIGDPGNVILDGLEFGAWRDWARADGLWQTTCFEAFVGKFGEPGYWELNFSPAQKKWNCYRFDGYRSPQPPCVSADFELSEVQSSKTHLRCVVAPKEFSVPFESSLAAVIRTAAGIRYFALTHAAAKPDFHRRDSFTLRI